jgi:hypothetical protein
MKAATARALALDVRPITARVDATMARWWNDDVGKGEGSAVAFLTGPKAQAARGLEP